MFKCSDVLTLIWQEVLLQVYRWNGSGVVHEKEFHCVKENSFPGSALNKRSLCHLGRFPQVSDKCWNDATLQMNVPPQTLWGAIRKIEQWFFSRRRPTFGLFVMRLIRSQKWSAWLCSSGCTEEQLAVITVACVWEDLLVGRAAGHREQWSRSARIWRRPSFSTWSVSLQGRLVGSAGYIDAVF